MSILDISEESRIYMILYVDNILILGRDRAEIKVLKQKLHEIFSMQELEEDRHIVGMRID